MYELGAKIILRWMRERLIRAIFISIGRRVFWNNTSTQIVDLPKFTLFAAQDNTLSMWWHYDLILTNTGIRRKKNKWNDAKKLTFWARRPSFGGDGRGATIEENWINFLLGKIESYCRNCRTSNNLFI